MILDGDQVIYNSEILSPYFEKSGYNSVWIEKETDEWLQQVKNHTVVSCSRTGGNNGWKLYSISRWSKKDGMSLKKDLEYEFELRKNRDIYWDDVVMFCHFDHYDLDVYPMKEEDVLEIDGLNELISIDPSYGDLYEKTN